MPEAAEVEIVRRGLAPLVGERLLAVEADPRLGISANHEAIEGRELLNVSRCGKLLGMEFGELVLTSHLRMTGRWSVRGAEPQARAVLRFSESVASFTDPRGFATLDLAPAATWTAKLGPDLFSLARDWVPEEGDRRRRRAVKATLLDQSICAGIGNYLADEALWSAEVHPAQPGSKLDDRQWVALYRRARELATEALAAGGTTFRDFAGADGQPGSGRALLVVYGQAGKPCLRCQTMLVKTRVAGRGTTLCPRCQQLSGRVS